MTATRAGTAPIVRLGRATAWTVFIAGLLLFAFLLAWQAWAAANFGYRFWHNHLGIAQAITRYGPQNRYRHHFQDTTLAERARLFGQIVTAIQGDTAVLPKLKYHAPDGRVIDRLLRPPEIQHLTDVSRLVALFRRAALVGSILTLAVAVMAAVRGWPLPSLSALLAGVVVAAAALGLALLCVGPTAVFYAMHRTLFPPGHEWFFYYQDSLMSLMMKAPALFGGIAAELAATALPLFGLLLAVQRRLHRRFARET